MALRPRLVLALAARETGTFGRCLWNSKDMISYDYHIVYYLLHDRNTCTPPTLQPVAARRHGKRCRTRCRCPAACRRAPHDRESPRQARHRVAKHDQPLARCLVETPWPTIRCRPRGTPSAAGIRCIGRRGAMAANLGGEPPARRPRATVDDSHAHDRQTA